MILDKFTDDMLDHSKSNSTIDFHTDFINPYILSTKLLDINTLSDKELEELITNNFHDILNDCCNSKNGPSIYLQYMLNTRFLSTFAKVIKNANNNPYQYGYTINDKTNCNKIIYDFTISSYFKQDKFKLISELMINLGKVINIDYIPRLLSIGYSDALATIFAVTRFSSTKIDIIIERINCLICNQSVEFMTVQRIADTFMALYDGSIIALFEVSMLDSDYPEMNNTDVGLLYNRISLALLGLIELMRSDDIFNLILMYSRDYVTLYTNKRVRFSLRNISQDQFPRIYKVLQSIAQYNVYLP